MNENVKKLAEKIRKVLILVWRNKFSKWILRVRHY